MIKFKTILLVAIFYLSQSNMGLLMADNELPPTVYYSPDKLYSIEISKLDDQGGIDRFLFLKKQGKIIIATKTIGYLQNVYWSPNGKYVAVNNRRGHFGDYLWVFSMDGKIVKKPDDPIKNIIINPYSEFHDDDLYSGFIFTLGWNDKNQLTIKECNLYKNMPDYLEYISYCSISNNQLVTDKQEIHKKPRSDEK